MKYFDSSRRSFLGKSGALVAGTALLSTQVSFGNIITESAPFEGYNPYVDLKDDLRIGFHTSKSVVVKGKVYDGDGKTLLSNATLEVWHLSPGSSKFDHRGKVVTNDKGEYKFITDFPNNKDGKLPRIYFKTSHQGKVSFNELIIGQRSVFISGQHWVRNNVLNEKVFPTRKNRILETQIQFNYTINN